MSLEFLDHYSAADVESVARLHENYLADSPVVALGPRFIRQFYYRKLVQDGLLGCIVCRADGRVVGFISYTREPRTFMSLGIHRHFWFLSWVMGVTILTRPAILKHIWATWRMMGDRARDLHEKPTPGGAEVISMATEKEYLKHVPPGGKSRVPARLYEKVIEHLRDEGFARVIFLVQPSNTASNLFFAATGCEFDKIMIAGAPVHRYTRHLHDAS